MTSDKRIQARIIHTHDTQANWKAAKNFVPEKGELIIYDTDIVNTKVRFKLGDGVTTVNELPFALDEALDDLFVKDEEGVMYLDAGNISDY